MTPTLLLLVAAAAVSVSLAAEQVPSYSERGYDDCRADGDVCARAHHCCSGTCLRHTCWSNPHHRPPCREHSDPCLDSEDCCGALVCGPIEGHTHSICHTREVPPPPPPTPTSCFAGASTVVVRGAHQPVAIREVRTGQRVLCFDGGHDMTQPGAPRWCEVKNWVRSDEALFDDMVKLSFSTPDGTASSTTLAAEHIVHLLTAADGVAPARAGGKAAAAPTAKDLGPFVHDTAGNVRPGQVLALATSRDASTRFVPVMVERVERVTAWGKFVPALEAPYIWVDGVVMPLWTTPGPLYGRFPDAHGVANAALHLAYAPLWMEAHQPLGTAGFNGSWDGNPRAPLHRAMKRVFNSPGRDGRMPQGTPDFTDALSWFARRYEAWKADPAAAISEADALAAWRGWWSGEGLLAADEAGATCAAAPADTPTMLPASVAAACAFAAARPGGSECLMS